MGKRYKLKNKDSEIKRLYEVEKKSLEELAFSFGVTRQAIYLRLLNMGVNLRRPGRPKRMIKRQSLVHLYTVEKLTQREIAQKLKIGLKLTQRKIKEFNLSKRSAEYIRLKYSEVSNLEIGKTAILDKPDVKNPHRSIYEAARKMNIKVVIRSIDEKRFMVMRIK